jgi:hypothetical protein
MSMVAGCRAFAPNGHRRAIAERLMKAALVIEGEVFADAGPRIAFVGVALQIDVRFPFSLSGDAPDFERPSNGSFD